MGTVSFYVDSAERASRAEVLALAAAYTALVINSRHEDGSSVCRRVFHHMNGVSGTMFGARTAMVAVGHGDAVLLDPHRVTDMNEGLVFSPDSLNSAGRTHLGTTCTLRSAVTALEGHLRLHQSHRVGRRPQHVVRTRTHAELTRRAMAVHVPSRHRPGRGDRRLPVRRYLVFYLRKTTIHLDLCLRHCRRTYRHRRTRQESTFRLINRAFDF